MIVIHLFHRSIWEITDEINLDDYTLNLPEKVILRFTCGSFKNGEISFNNTFIEHASYQVFDSVVKAGGRCSFENLNPIMFGADNTGDSDASESIQKAIDFSNGDDVNLVAGKYLVESTIIIKRGVALVGQSTFDSKGSTILIRANNMDEPVLATEDLPQGANYYVLRGLCILGNMANQTVFKFAIQWNRAFVGSYIDNVFVYQNYGGAIDFRNSYDTKIGLFWSNRCTLDGDKNNENNENSSLIRIHSPNSTGLLEFDSLYIENPTIRKGGDARDYKTDRGVAIKASNIYRIYIKALHIEGCDVGFELIKNESDTEPVKNDNRILKIDQMSASQFGDSQRKNSLIYFNTIPLVCDIGACVRLGTEPVGFKWLGLSSNVVSSNLI